MTPHSAETLWFWRIVFADGVSSMTSLPVGQNPHVAFKDMYKPEELKNMKFEFIMEFKDECSR